MAEGFHQHEQLQGQHQYGVTEEALRHPEAITAAAIRLNGVLYWDVTHAHITMNQLSDTELDQIQTLSDDEGEAAYGFLTTYGRFISRHEAYELAQQQHQLKEDDGSGRLESEKVNFVTYH
jgi:hypothetical protein